MSRAGPRTDDGERVPRASGLDVSAYPRHLLHLSLVRIRDAADAVRGAGVLATERLVCTCAHVVCDALGLPRDHPDLPSGSVRVDFPHAPGTGALATVIRWVPEEDTAVLALTKDAPSKLDPARLLAQGSPRGGRFETYGYPATADDVGMWAEGTFGLARSDGTVQLEADPTRYRIQPGFSGAGVWDRERRGIAGLVIAADERRGAAVMLPLDRVARAHPALSLTSPPDRYGGLSRMGHRDTDADLDQFLGEYLGTPLRPKAFGGRQRVLHALDEWLLDRPEPYTLLVADAGRGKSAVLANWALELAESERVDVAFVPLSLRFQTAGSSRFLELLGRRLRQLAPFELGDQPSSPLGWQAEIRETLRTGFDHTDSVLLIIVDGLDEAAGWRFEQVRLPEPGPGVKVALSTRPAGRTARDWSRVLGIEGLTHEIALPPLRAPEVLDVLRATVLPPFDGPRAQVASVLAHLTIRRSAAVAGVHPRNQNVVYSSSVNHDRRRFRPAVRERDDVPMPKRTLCREQGVVGHGDQARRDQGGDGGRRSRGTKIKTVVLSDEEVVGSSRVLTPQAGMPSGA